MEYRKLGRHGLKLSAVSLGSWRTFGQSRDDGVTETCLKAAYDAGVNFFDGAEGYGAGAAESALGRAFQKFGWPRDTFCVSSKVYWGGDRPTQTGLSRKHLVDACDAALRRLGVEYLDLYFCHRPDPDTPLEEIVQTMNELIGRGKILYWGTSNFSGADLLQLGAIAERDGRVGPAMEQPRYNLLDRDTVERELAPVFRRYGIGATVYSPLAVGVLSGKYRDGIPAGSALDGAEWLRKKFRPEDAVRADRVVALAAELGMTGAQLALAWCLKNPNVTTAITGASRPEQVVENVAAADMTDRLTGEVLQRIDEALA